MNASIYKAVSGAIAEMRRLDVAAQDLANVSTTGYKGQRITFGEVLAGSAPGSERPGGLVATADQKTNFLPGEMQSTGNPFHLAISGDGLFAVQTSRGERYTKNGSFTLRADGTIVTSGGDPVLGEGGPLQISGANMQVAADGTVSSDGTEVGKLRVVRLRNPQLAIKEGANHFGSAPANIEVVADPIVQQGALEASNVNPIEGMVSLITLHRQFEAYQKAMGLIDSLTQKAITNSPE
jgi:flagellar basal-body rod protein FlgF